MKIIRKNTLRDMTTSFWRKPSLGPKKKKNDTMKIFHHALLCRYGQQREYPVLAYLIPSPIESTCRYNYYLTKREIFDRRIMSVRLQKRSFKVSSDLGEKTSHWEIILWFKNYKINFALMWYEVWGIDKNNNIGTIIAKDYFLAT